MVNALIGTAGEAIMGVMVFILSRLLLFETVFYASLTVAEKTIVDMIPLGIGAAIAVGIFMTLQTGR